VKHLTDAKEKTKTYRNEELITDGAFEFIVALCKEFGFKFFFLLLIVSLLLLRLLPLDRLLLLKLIVLGFVLFLQSKKYVQDIVHIVNIEFDKNSMKLGRSN